MNVVVVVSNRSHRNAVQGDFGPGNVYVQIKLGRSTQSIPSTGQGPPSRWASKLWSQTRTGVKAKVMAEQEGKARDTSGWERARQRSGLDGRFEDVQGCFLNKEAVGLKVCEQIRGL